MELLRIEGRADLTAEPDHTESVPPWLDLAQFRKIDGDEAYSVSHHVSIDLLLLDSILNVRLTIRLCLRTIVTELYTLAIGPPDKTSSLIYTVVLVFTLSFLECRHWQILVTAVALCIGSWLATARFAIRQCGFILAFRAHAFVVPLQLVVGVPHVWLALTTVTAADVAMSC